MLKMMMQSTVIALGLVVVVLGIMVIIGKTDFLPFLIGAGVLFVGDLVVLLVLRKNEAASKEVK